MEIVFSYPGRRPHRSSTPSRRRLPAAAGHLPGDLADGPARLAARRRRLRVRRSARADGGGVLMSALTSPLGSGPGGPSSRSPRRSSAAGAASCAACRSRPRSARSSSASSSSSRSSGPWVAPYDPSATTAGQALPMAPTASHLLGTTATGQDVLSQLLAGTRSTVVLGLLTGAIATLLAVVVGHVGRLPRRDGRRGAVAAGQCVPRAPGAAAAGGRPRLPAPLRPAADRDRPQRARAGRGGRG